MNDKLQYSICGDIRLYLASFLSTKEFSVIQQLSTFYKKHGNDFMSCISTYKLNHVQSCDRLTNDMNHHYLQHVIINCDNKLIPSHMMVLNNVHTITFYSDYSTFSSYYKWNDFFDSIQIPNIKCITWKNIDFSFSDMLNIFLKHQLHDSVEQLNIMPHFIRRTNLTMELVELYKKCHYLTRLRLDYEDKHFDYHYMHLFNTSMDFSKLCELQLVNRSRSIIDYICSNEHLLSNLKILDIMWIYDTSAFHDYENNHEFQLIVRKQLLREIKLTYYAWDFQLVKPIVCLLSVHSNHRIYIINNRMDVIVIDCPKGYTCIP